MDYDSASGKFGSSFSSRELNEKSAALTYVWVKYEAEAMGDG